LRVSQQPHPSPAANALAARPEDIVEVGRVLGAWGVKGGIRVKAFSSDPQALFAARQWFLEPGDTLLPRPAGAQPLPPMPRQLHIVNVREQGDSVVATAEELTDRDAAQALAGVRVLVSRAHFPTPDKDEFYWIDLIGLSVLNREGVALGVVVGLIETGPHCVLRLQPAEPAAEERLIPFVDAYVDRVEMAARCIHVDWDPDY
jgi:16S rRNA processing protein RimM